jgi:hypothetical protein
MLVDEGGGIAQSVSALGVQGAQYRRDMGRASCVRDQLHGASESKRDGQQGMQVRAAAGVEEPDQVGRMPAPQGSRSHTHQRHQELVPAFDGEHSPQSRWIVGAVRWSRRTPSCSPHLGPAIKNDIG